MIIFHNEAIRFVRISVIRSRECSIIRQEVKVGPELFLEEKGQNMSSKKLSSIADEYFYNLNPLAQRIGEDVAATRDAYEGLWNTLSLTERNQVIDETIIQPEVALKYTRATGDSTTAVSESYPKLRIQTGMKYMIDETGSTLRWRDEHSAPFSTMTQSQMNLNLFDSQDDVKSKPTNNFMIESRHFASPLKGSRDTDILHIDNFNHSEVIVTQRNFHQSDNFTEKKYSNSERDSVSHGCVEKDSTDNIFSKLINKTSLLKIQNKLDNDDKESLVPQKNLSIKASQKYANGEKNQMNINLTSSTRSKTNEIDESTALLETPGSYSSFQSSQLNQDDNIPKTGFEFLDNW